MNLLGRLFIVLIFIGSIMLVSFSVALYATHTNWRERANKLELDLKAKTQELADLQKSKAGLETALRLEIKSQKDRNQALRTANEQLKQDVAGLQAQKDQLNVDLTARVAAVQTVADMAEALRNRLDGTSNALLDAQKDWNEMSTQLSKKVDEAHDLAIQVASYQSTGAQLAKDYRDVVEVLRKHGLSADPELYSKQPPAGVQGMVTEVRPGGIVEISIGSDSGIVKGHQLDIVRDRGDRSSYIGKIEIIQTAADCAVAKVMPEFRRGVVQREDVVTYIDVNTVATH